MATPAARYGRLYGSLHSSTKWRRATKGARALWTSAHSWSTEQRTNGFIPADMLRILDGTAREAADLVRVGLWEEVDGGWAFHEWLDHNRSAEQMDQKLETNRERVARWRERQRDAAQKASGNALRTPVRNGVREEERREEVQPATQAVPRQPSGGSPHAILAGHGLDETQRDAFLTSLAAGGITKPSVFVVRLHQRGDLAARIDEWRIDTGAAATVASTPREWTTWDHVMADPDHRAACDRCQDQWDNRPGRQDGAA